MTKHQSFFLAGVEGIEPSSGVLETLILPMNYTPKLLNAFLFYYNLIFMSIDLLKKDLIAILLLQIWR